MQTERVIFRELPHDYRGVESGLFYTPVSTVAKKFLPDVDWDAMLERSAKKSGTTPERLKAYWDLKKNLGTSVGTYIHAIEESKLFEDGVDELGLKVVPYEVEGSDKYQIQNIKPGHAYPELITSINKDHVRIAGTSDKLSVDNQGFVHILDYKTDYSIDTKSFYDWKSKKYSMLKYPLDGIINSNYWIYGLKMSMYMFFTLHSYPEFKPGTILLEHKPLLRTEDKVPILNPETGLPQVLEDKVKLIDVDYGFFEPHIRKMLNAYYKMTKV